ncbi:MAG: nucleoside hydrolase [Eubacteriales bacterium]
MSKIPLIIDCDPGVDDVLAIVMAKHVDRFDIKAITSVSGNVGIDLTTRNAQLIAGLLDLKCVVARGAEEPLVKAKREAGHVHGADGIGGTFEFFPKNCKKELSKFSALNVLRDTLLNSEERVSIVAIGPLTNIGLLLKTYPEVKEKIEVISIMGGAINNGNATPCSEYNFLVDPEAASIVFKSGVPLIMAGINLTVKVTLTKENLEEIKNIGSNLSEIGHKMIVDYTTDDPAIHDPCAVLALSHSDMFKWEDLHVQIDTREGFTQGMSYADYRLRDPKKPNCRVLTDIDLEKFRKLTVDSFK